MQPIRARRANPPPPLGRARCRRSSPTPHLAAQLERIPKSMRKTVVDQTRQGLEALPPEMRDAYIEMYRSMGVPL